MTHIRQRRDTAANWTSINPVLQLGEVGWETNTRKAKLGDGVTPWTGLLYASEPATVPPVTSVNGYTGAVVLDRTDVGLGNVNNTSDALKPVSTPQAAAIAAKADLSSPTFTGTPLAPTAATSTNSTQIATTAFVKANVNTKADLVSPVFTGDPKAPTPATTDNDTSIATTAYVKAAIGMTQPLKSGSITVSASAATSGTAALVFPVPFTGAGTPNIVVSVAAGSTVYIAGSGAHTNAGCNVILFRRDGASFSASVTVNWIATKP